MEIVPLLISGFTISLYLSILFLATIISALLYYVQPNRLLLKNLLKIKKISKNYPKYRGINLSNSVDHIFIKPESIKFGTKLFFCSTLALILITFIGEAIEILVFIFAFFIISLLLLIPLLVKDWKSLSQRVKLIYFMKQFIQENKMLENSKKDIVKNFILNLEKNLWFEAGASFSQFLEIYLISITEPLHLKIYQGELLERFYNYILYFFDRIDDLGGQPHHEIANYFFDKMKLDISAGSSKSDRYLLDYIKPINLAFIYLRDFIDILNSWDKWLIQYVFERENIELNQIIKQIKIMIELFNKNNEYQTLISKHRLLKSNDIKEPQINNLKEEIYTQYQKIIRHFATLENTLILLNIKNFFKKDLLKEYLEKIKEKVYILETNLKLKERMTEGKYQEIFIAISETLKFSIQNYNLLHYQYDVSTIFQHIDLLKKFKYDLDKFNILIDFSKPHELKFKLDIELEIIIPFEQEGLFSRKIKDIKTANPQRDLEKQKKIIYEYLNECSRNFNLKIEDDVFWKNKTKK